jgi:hypothetical protein
MFPTLGHNGHHNCRDVGELQRRPMDDRDQQLGRACGLRGAVTAVTSHRLMIELQLAPLADWPGRHSLTAAAFEARSYLYA